MTPLYSWSQVSFEAVCNAREVLTGNPFEVSFKVQNANIKALDPPNFNGLQAQGPQIGQAISYVNGKSSMSQSYTYYVVANKPGNYKIGAAKVITAQGQTLYTKPITVKVVEKSSNSVDDSKLSGQVFLRTELSNTDAVVGEQITVDIRIYTKIGIEQTELIKEPTFENVFSHYLRSFSDQPKIVVVNGEQYITQILRRIVVFPSKPGTIVVEPAIVDIGIASSRQSLFNPFALEAHTLKSLPVELNVKALGGAANGFSGVVGAYDMKAHVEKNSITSDEMVELTLRIRGEGDIKQVLAPNIGANAKYFDQFDPNVNEDVREGGGLLGGFKEFQYVLTPKATGDFTLNPKFTYFDSKEKRFITLDTTINVQITKGNTNLPTKAERDAIKDDVEVIEEAEAENLLEFKAPQTEAEFVHLNESKFLGSALFWILSLLPFLGLAFFFWKKQQDDTKANIPTTERKRQNAHSEATVRLQKAKENLAQGNSKEFFNEISKALLGFVGDKYGIPQVELTKNNLRQKLANQSIASEKIESLMSILQTCEMALFAGLTNNESMEKVYQESEALIQLMDS